MENQVIYLLDTNIWLESLLEQENSATIKILLNNLHPQNIIISDFSFHSIGVIMTRYGKYKEFDDFINDLFIINNISILSLSAKEMKDVSKNIKKHKFDFDDSYQYTLAQKFGLKIITFDKDFRHKGDFILTPAEVVKIIRKK